eukprot:6405123-Prorocentrum_lima.AAC.1
METDIWAALHSPFGNVFPVPPFRALLKTLLRLGVKENVHLHFLLTCFLGDELVGKGAEVTWLDVPHSK